MAQFDVIVIGAGPAGYIAAIRCAQLGMKVACVEEWKTPKGEGALGGTCLNVGCIPSKALLESSEQYEHALKGLGEHGITVSGAKVDLAKMLGRKDAIVSKMTKGIEFLFRKNKIEWLKGHGKFVSAKQPWQIDVNGEVAEAKHVIIATGSRARHLPNVPVDKKIAQVWVLAQDGTVRQQVVTTGIADSLFTEIDEGALKESDAVVIGIDASEEQAQKKLPPGFEPGRGMR